MENEKNIRTVSYLETKDGELFNLYPPISSEEKPGGIKTVNKTRNEKSQTVAIDNDGYAFVDAQSGEVVSPKEEATDDTQIAYLLGEKQYELVEKKELNDAISEVNESITNMGNVVNGKLDRPTDAPEVGKILKIKEVNDDGSFVCEWAEGSGGNVKINGVETTDNNIPYAVHGYYGLIKISGIAQDGLQINPYSNVLQPVYQNTYGINTRGIGTLSTANIDYVTKVTMSAPIADKAGLVNGVYHYPAWTAEEQANAQARLGIYPMSEEGY